MTMRKVPASAAVLALGLACLMNGRAADDNGPRKSVEKLAGLAARSPGDLQKQADAYAKNLDSLEDVKVLLKKRQKTGKGGFGVGPVASGKSDDGIEARILNLSKRAPAADQLKQDSADLIQMLHRTRAVAAITLAKVPDKKEGKKDPKDWQRYAEAMQREADALTKAVEAADPAAVKAAAVKLNASCTSCHERFRD